MKKLFKLFICMTLFPIVFGCSGENKNKISLDKRHVELVSVENTFYINSKGSGFIVKDICEDGKSVAEHTSDEDGSLMLKTDWVTVVTPGCASGELVHSMQVFVEANDEKYDRECKIIVRNGSERDAVEIVQLANHGKDD